MRNRLEKSHQGFSLGGSLLCYAFSLATPALDLRSTCNMLAEQLITPNASEQLDSIE